MAILDITLRLGSTTQTESSSNKKESAQPNNGLAEQVLSCKSFTYLRQTSAVPSLTNRDPIVLSSSLPSPVFLVQSGLTVSSHPQPQSSSPTDKATGCCSPTEDELTIAFEDDNSLYYDCETSLTVSSSFMMDEQNLESIESQQTSGPLIERLESGREEAKKHSRTPHLTALRDQTQDHPPSYSRIQLTQSLNNICFDIRLEDSFEKSKEIVAIPRCELLKLDMQSLNCSQNSSSSERTFNSSSKSSKGKIQSETSTSLVDDHTRSTGCLDFDHLKKLDIPDNDSTVPGENFKKKIDLLKIQSNSKFLVKLSSIELDQVPKSIKNISKTPSWTVLKPLGPTTSVTFATASALLS
ncbi:hypothetical protein CROQUDRAFT_110587 [Cronartium quercuum f. sp. fusiforme G11]|uniref:Uncharacterized protein n=1 Tax=Cronartium quercuum f. sp. fusiforme G11 TaxID=708437 RepID=A0A9P6N7G2_9BASI|nr:hypothetical protein CROQUDRAFT_110587 [Cronartium quercuum f. sp. fusiforme G11]